MEMWGMPSGAYEVQYVDSPEDLAAVTFTDGMAAIEVPAHALHLLPFKNHTRGNDPRLKAVLNQIRWHGYNNANPIIVRLGRRGRWVVTDGGHRLTAAMKVRGEFLTNLFGEKVKSIYFLLYRTPLSESKLPNKAA